MNPTPPPPRSRRRLPRRIGAALFALALSGAPVLAEPFGSSVEDGALIRVDLATGEPVDIGPTGLAVDSVRSLTEDADGTLWALGRTAGVMLALARIDPDTGAGTLVGTVGPAPAPALEMLETAPDSSLVTVLDENLVRVDRDSGAPTTVGVVGPGVVALVTVGSDLLAFRQGAVDCDLEVLDLSDASSAPLLSAVPCPTAVAHEAGSRVLVGLTSAPIPTSQLVAVERLEIETGTIEPVGSWASLEGAPTGLANLTNVAAVRGAAPVVEVPTLGGLGLAVLVLLVGVVSVAAVRRRAGVGSP